jgi:hypothetical protein
LRNTAGAEGVGFGNGAVDARGVGGVAGGTAGLRASRSGILVASTCFATTFATTFFGAAGFVTAARDVAAALLDAATFFADTRRVGVFFLEAAAAAPAVRRGGVFTAAFATLLNGLRAASGLVVFFAAGLRAAAFFATFFTTGLLALLAVEPVFFAAAGFALARTGAVASRFAGGRAARLLTGFFAVLFAGFFAAFFDAAFFIAILQWLRRSSVPALGSSVASPSFTQLKRDRAEIEDGVRPLLHPGLTAGAQP